MEHELTTPNAALGHVTDSIGDLDGFGPDQLDDAGRTAAEHADITLRDAMGEDVIEHDLLMAAAYCIERAGRSNGWNLSMLFPLRKDGDPRDHVTLDEVGHLISRAGSSRS